MIFLALAFAHPLEKEVTKLVSPAIDEEVLHGVVVKVITPREVRTVSLGSFKKNPERSPFEIGTVSAAFTGYLLAEAVHRQEVTLDDPLSKHVDFPVPDGITLRQLATHTSGLPSLPPDFQPVNPQDPFASFDEAALAAAAAKVELRDPPGEIYSPSHLGMALLGQALAHAAHSSWPELLAQRVSQPLKLKGFGADTPPPIQGHNADGEPTPEWILSAFGPAGGVHGSPSALTRFLQQLLTDSGPVTSLVTLQQLDLGEVGGVALGWNIAPDGTHWQNGQTAGFHCLIAFHPARRHGVVVLSDTASELVDSIGFNTLALLSDTPVQPLHFRHEVEVNSADLQKLVGTYGDVNISVEGSSLVLTRHGESLRLTPESATVFFRRTENMVAEFTPNTLILETNGARPEVLARAQP